MNSLSFTLADEMAALAASLQRSLVVLHNGRAGVGAGVIWKRDGWVVTNHHVVAGRRNRSAHRDLRVELFDGRVFPARRGSPG